MKKIAALLVAATLALTGATSAQAEWGHRHGGHGYGHHGHHGHRGGHGWVGPAAVLAITGLAIGAAVASQHSYAPAPVYSAPPRPMPSADYGTWYYCGSSGQYYPYTNACPEGWQAVPAR
ncbi:MAG: hypothetical protein H6R14_1774 [Proteobacteria bacterium]|nr:hypothetical protein [Pseudomonadota bacterium]